MDDSECRDCILFFVCDGGCPYKRIKNKIENKNYDICNYKKRNLNEFLELHYEYKINNKSKI